MKNLIPIALVALLLAVPVLAELPHPLAYARGSEEPGRSAAELPHPLAYARGWTENAELGRGLRRADEGVGRSPLITAHNGHQPAWALPGGPPHEAEEPGRGSAKDEAAIRELVRQYVDAREHIDPTATAKLFTADADQLVSSGEWRKGREQVVEGSMKSSKASTGKRTIAVETIRFLADDIAIVDGHYDLAGNTASEARHMWTTLLVKRSPDGWRIAAIRNMLPAK